MVVAELVGSFSEQIAVQTDVSCGKPFLEINMKSLHVSSVQDEMNQILKMIADKTDA